MADKGGSGKQVVFLGLFIGILVLIAAGYMLMARGPVKNSITTKGDRAPEFRLQSMDGKYISLSELKGKVVMVHFWATWCPPCVEEIPTLDKLYREFMGKDFEMLAISVDEGGIAAVAPFMQKNHLHVPIFFDPRRSIAGAYGTFKFPETYILDRGGIVRHKVIGPADWTSPENKRILQEIIDAR